MNELIDNTDSNYPDMLAELSDHFVAQFTARGFDAETAARLGREATEVIRCQWGGQTVYVPKGTEYALSQRDLEIFNKFNGSNVSNLCQQYRLTDARIYQIIKAVRKEQVRLRQLNLFDAPTH